jgi:hypothetical protein
VRSFGEDGGGEAQEDGDRAVEEDEDAEEVRGTTGRLVVALPTEDLSPGAGAPKKAPSAKPPGEPAAPPKPPDEAKEAAKKRGGAVTQILKSQCPSTFTT